MNTLIKKKKSEYKLYLYAVYSLVYTYDKKEYRKIKKTVTLLILILWVSLLNSILFFVVVIALFMPYVKFRSKPVNYMWYRKLCKCSVALVWNKQKSIVIYWEKPRALNTNKLGFWILDLACGFRSITADLTLKFFIWKKKPRCLDSVQFSSVAQSCPTLCDPMNRSTPGLPVHHQLPEFTETHVHRVSDAI